MQKMTSTFNVCIILLTGKKTKIQVNESWTVLQLKTEFAKYENGITYDTIKFIYQARHMRDNKILKEYKMKQDDVIQAAVRSVGGLAGTIQKIRMQYNDSF